jgi:hypothetical protein
MFFKKFLRKDVPRNKAEKVQPENTNEEVIEINPVSESSEDTADQYLFGSSIFFRKMKNLYSGPDMFYENEAWAPENEYIGLFRKRRTQFEGLTSEEQTSTNAVSE